MTSATDAIVPPHLHVLHSTHPESTVFPGHILPFTATIPKLHFVTRAQLYVFATGPFVATDAATGDAWRTSPGGPQRSPSRVETFSAAFVPSATCRDQPWVEPTEAVGIVPTL